jgi:hypothetical protein
MDGYYVEIDRNSNGIVRSIDFTLINIPQVSFNEESSVGSDTVHATENIQYDAIIPSYNIITPGSTTSVNGAIRSISGTSVSGNEVSFTDLGFEPIELNRLNKLNSTRIVASKINELTYLNSIVRNKSFATSLTLTTTDPNLSPMIFSDTAFTEYRSNRINAPVGDYVKDSSTNTLIFDRHAAHYVSNSVRLKQPATSLKVILSACRPDSTDFRVLYRLVRADSSEVEQTFDLFPGYNNLTTDTDGDGIGNIVINSSLNDGTPDLYVNPSRVDEFLEYQFTADNLGEFVGYSIKIAFDSTDQSRIPRIKDLRTIAIR